jgi:hypothetical protein
MLSRTAMSAKRNACMVLSRRYAGQCGKTLMEKKMATTAVMIEALLLV